MTFKYLFIIIFSYIIIQQPTSLHAQSFMSKQIPSLTFTIGTIFDQLQNTIWVATDIRNGTDLYVVFNNNKFGRSAVLRGAAANYPKNTYPMKFIQEGNLPNSGIFLVPSQDKILYYSFHFLNQYYLLISPGYNQIEPLLELEIPDYLADGYILQLVY